MKFLLALLFAVSSNPALAGIEKCTDLYKSNNPMALEECYPLAEEKNPDAQKMIGDMYYWGWGDRAEKNLDRAIAWYKKAAINGNLDAKYAMGVLYEKGEGIKIDYVRAIKWYYSAASKGHINAQFNLANMYAKGAGVEQNQRMAVKWYVRAANQGDAVAQYNLANRYALGNGISQDLMESYKWYTIAKEGGIAEAEKGRKNLEKSMADADVKKARVMAHEWLPTFEQVEE